MRKLLSLFCVFLLVSCASPKKNNKIDYPTVSREESKISVEETFSLPSAQLSIEQPVLEEDSFSSDVYGPFEVGGPDIKATFNYRMNIMDQEVIERMRFFDSNNRVLRSENHSAFKYTKLSSITTSFTIPIHNYLTNKGIILKFELLNSGTREIIKAYSATIYPYKKQTWFTDELKHNVYQSESLGFYGDGTGLKEAKEQIDFTLLGDYLSLDYYYKLNLKSARVKYISPFGLTYSGVNLRFEDHDNLFPLLTHDDNRDIVLPLKATALYNTYSFSFRDTMYVKKDTLEMSDTLINGFSGTNDLYLPINQKDKFNNKLIYLDFVEFGKSKITASFPLRYTADSSLLGLCDEGGFCLVGGVK